MAVIGIVAALVLFGCAALLASELSGAICARVAPEEDGPPLGEAPLPAIVSAAGLIGVALVFRGGSPLQIGIGAVFVFSLAASWCSDSKCGIVPDAFTLIPLSGLLLLSALRGDWWVILSAVIAFVPFAAAAAFSRGNGMGWGDAKLVALAGAALGAELAILALILACIAAAIGYRIRGIKSGPIAFAPYIATFAGLAIPFGIVR